MALRPERVLDVVSGELLSGRAVLVEDDRIDDVVAAPDVPGDVPVLDLPGHTLLPGLIDCHAHLVGEEDSGHGYTELLTRTGAQEAMTGSATPATPCSPASPACATSAPTAPSSTSRSATRSRPAGRPDRG